MHNPAQRPATPSISRLSFSWRKAVCCTLLTAASIIATNTYAKEPEPPGLFSRLPGKSRERLPEQAFPGRSHTVKINRGQLRRGRLFLRLPGGISIEAIRDLRQNMGNKRFSWVGLPAGTLYYYRVAAYNDSGQSGNSNSDSARTDEPVSKYLSQQDLLL